MKKRTNAEIVDTIRELAQPSKTLSRFDVKALKEIADQIASYPDLPDKPITEAYFEYHQNLTHVAGQRVAYEHCRNILREPTMKAYTSEEVMAVERTAREAAADIMRDVIERNGFDDRLDIFTKSEIEAVWAKLIEARIWAGIP